MDPGIEAALAALLYDLLVDLQDLRLVAFELWHQARGEAEIRRADIDAVDAFDVEDLLHVLDRRLGFHHRQQHDLVVGGLLVGAGRAVHAGADRAVGARALRRILGIGNEVPRFLRSIDHRADHAIGAAVEHLADDAGLVPGHADHRRDGVAVHRLEALHHGQIVLHAVLHVDGDAVEAALRDHLGGKSRRNRKPGVHHGLARGPYFFDIVCCHCVSFLFAQTHRHCEERSDEAIHSVLATLDCFASLAMTLKPTPRPAVCSPRSRRPRARYSLSPPRYRQARGRRFWCAPRASLLPARPGSARHRCRRPPWYP